MASDADEEASEEDLRELLAKRHAPPSVKEMDWSIDGRRDIQKTMLRLYKCFQNHGDKLEDKSELGMEGRDLVSVAFSLWRAVFLSDRVLKLRNLDAKDFLEKVLTDNAIGFPQDRSMRAWSFYYYRDNAYYRVLAYSDKDDLVNGEPIIPPKGENKPQRQWEVLHDALKYLVGEFEKKLGKKSAKK